MDASFQEPVALAIVGIVAGLFVFNAFRNIRRARRNGETLSACGGCGTCPSSTPARSASDASAQATAEAAADPAMPTSCRAKDFTARLDVYRDRARASGKT